MGTWICHFRVAESLLDFLPECGIHGVDARLFVIGNVAPDSGRPNHDWTRFEPPKTVTHFLRPGEDEGSIRDLMFYREQVGSFDPEDAGRSSFLLGYFTHLVTDNLWMHLIGHATQIQFAAEFAADRTGTWNRVKDDWYDLDHKYLRDRPDNVFTQLVVNAPNPPSPLAFLPTEALAYRLDDLRAFYSGSSEADLDRVYPYLSEEHMNRAVQDCARSISVLLARLVRNEVRVEERVSLHVLDLPAPYILP